MPPTPMTTTDSPWVTLARLNTAPTPVSTPQPMSEAEVERHVVGDRHGLSGLDHRLLDEHRVLANWKAFSPRPPVNGRVSLPSDWRQNVGLPRSHCGALAAVAERRQHDVVADLHVGDVVGDLRDDAGALVAEHDRRREHDRAVDAPTRRCGTARRPRCCTRTSPARRSRTSMSSRNDVDVPSHTIPFMHCPLFGLGSVRFSSVRLNAVLDSGVSRARRSTASRSTRAARSCRRRGPTPDCLKPPKGASWLRCSVLMPTLPERSRLATFQARPVSSENT